MKNVSNNFKTKVAAANKRIDTAILVAWDKQIDDNRKFFTLGSSTLNGGDLIWSGNQDVISFMDRYKYTDESNNCKSWNVSRKVSNHPWGVVQGTASITLGNAAGRFFPGVDTEIGDYVNLPNRPVKIQISIDGEPLNLFSGYSTRPKVSVVNSEYKITAYDALSFLETKTSDLVPFVDKSLDYIISALLIEAGFDSTQFTLESAVQHDNIQYCAPKDRKVIELLNELCASEQYLLFADGDGIIHGWNANHYAVGDGDEDYEFNFSNATEMEWGSTSVLNDVVVEAKPYQIVESSKFYSMTDPTDDYLVPADGRIDIFLELRDSDDNPIYAIDFGTPTYDSSTGSSYTTNTEKDGSGLDNHDSIRLTSQYNFGSTIRLSFANDSHIPTYIMSIALVGSSAQLQEYMSVEAIDQNSIDNYGMNPDESDGEVYKMESSYIQSENFASSIAERMVKLYAKPLSKLNISAFPVPQLEFGDQIKATVGGYGEKNGLIFGIDMSGNSNAQFMQKLYLEERETFKYFTLDSSALNGEDILAF